MTNEGEVSMPDPTTPTRKRYSPVAIAALALAIAVAVLGALAGFGSRWGLWTFGTGFSLLRWAAYGGIAAAILGAAALYLARPGGPRRGFTAGVVALAVGLIAFGVPLQNARRAGAAPPIHDITTDTENPPEFVAIVPLRAEAPNPAPYDGPEVAAQQIAAYPDIRPVVLDMSFDRAYQRALDAAEAQGWEIVAANHDEGRIEATDQTFWFGFLDDIVIRVTPIDGRSILDIRSKSRVGRGDVGTNARRIREYLADVQP